MGRVSNQDHFLPNIDDQPILREDNVDRHADEFEHDDDFDDGNEGIHTYQLGLLQGRPNRIRRTYSNASSNCNSYVGDRFSDDDAVDNSKNYDSGYGSDRTIDSDEESNK